MVQWRFHLRFYQGGQWHAFAPKNLKIFKNGQAVDEIIGLQPKEAISEKIEAAIN